MIEDFRNHQRQEDALNSIGQINTPRNITKGVAATFKEDGVGSGNRQKSNYDDKECLCGLKHAWSNCYYLNPSTRTSSWKGRKEVYDKINKQLKHPKMRWVIKKFGYDGMNKEDCIQDANKHSEEGRTFNAFEKCEKEELQGVKS